MFAPKNTLRHTRDHGAINGRGALEHAHAFTSSLCRCTAGMRWQYKRPGIASWDRHSSRWSTQHYMSMHWTRDPQYLEVSFRPASGYASTNDASTHCGNTKASATVFAGWFRHSAAQQLYMTRIQKRM
jgi:hypothetical protein